MRVNVSFACISDPVARMNDALVSMSDFVAVGKKQSGIMTERVASWLVVIGFPLSQEQKSPAMEALFFFYSISSEYHMERINRPNIFEGIRCKWRVM